jgi:hypothetical protein
VDEGSMGEEKQCDNRLPCWASAEPPCVRSGFLYRTHCGDRDSKNKRKETSEEVMW